MVNYNDKRWALEIVVDNIERHGGSENTMTRSLSSHTDLKMSTATVTVLVRGDLTVGHVMASVSEELGPIQDWSDYSLWWPVRKQWLLNSRHTLDQYDVSASSKLFFTPTHKIVRIETPDKNIAEMRLDFSIDVFSSVAQLCSHLDLRHPEELSLALPLTPQQLSHNKKLDASTHATSTLSLTARTDRQVSCESYAPTTPNGNYVPVTPTTTTLSNGSLYNTSNGTMSSNTSLNVSNGTNGHASPVRDKVIRLKSLAKRARVNALWLNSSVSLYEQGVNEYDLVCLKYKYYTFHDLNMTKDIVRINYIYEQLRWAILTEELPCTEDEMYTLAGISLQIMLASGSVTPNNARLPTALFGTTNSSTANSTFYTNTPARAHANGNGHNGHNGHKQDTIVEDEIDSALENLERSLEGPVNGKAGHNRNGHSNNILVTPKLCAKLKIHAQRSVSTLSRLKFKNTYKPYYVLLEGTTLTVYKLGDYNEKSDAVGGCATFVLNLKTCEVNNCAKVSEDNYSFQILQPSLEPGRVVFWLKCANQTEFAQWFAACKQASLGRTMAHASYEEQLNSTLKLLQIQATQNKKDKTNGHSPLHLDLDSIQLEYLVASKFMKKRSKAEILNKIKNVHANFANSRMLDAQMSYIKTCQLLRNFSMSLFAIRFAKNKKEEYLGICPDRMVLMDTAGELLKTWRYSSLIDWNVNWEVKRMQINFNEDKIDFECLSADCKVIHEFIGGYIYMSMRHNMHNTHDRVQFLKLTGGWDETQQDAN